MGFIHRRDLPQARQAARSIGAASIWADGFVMNNGVGTGSASFSAQVHGSISGDMDISYALYISTKPFQLNTIIDDYENGHGRDFNPQVRDSARHLYTAIENGCNRTSMSGGCTHVPFENFQDPVDIIVTHSFDFVYGGTYYLARVLSGDISRFGGSGDFYHSAVVGITAFLGESISTLSGVQYVSAVPEVASFKLLAASLMILSALSFAIPIKQ